VILSGPALPSLKEKTMRRFQASLATLCGLCLASVALADADDPTKPAKAPTLDDRTATLTETLNGKEKTTKIDLKYSLGVQGTIDQDGYHLEEVDKDGPAAMLSDPSGDCPVAVLEQGDIITEVDGKKVRSAQDYAKAMNGAPDHNKIKLRVRDVNTGKQLEYYAKAVKR